MMRVKEYGLNTLLALLVALSIGLSARVWFPLEISGQFRGKEPAVQNPPVSLMGLMPDVYRPERIYIRQPESRVALLPAGSVAYKRIWRGVQDVLVGMRAVSSPQTVEDDRLPDAPSITMVFPTALTMGEWSEIWKWSASNARNFSLKVDTVTLSLDKDGVIYFSGSLGGPYRLGPIPQQDMNMLKDLVNLVDPGLFHTYRPLALKDPSLRVAPDVVVPDVLEVPIATLGVKKPDSAEEAARYFPDLSVVRQIDERDARSFTDGQRLVRLTSGGQLEYRVAHSLGTAPLREAALDAARDWVGLHGGWAQEVVMSFFSQQPGRTTMVFDLRMDGVYPVETATGAIGVEVTVDRDASGNARTSITQYRRYPDFIPHFGQTRRIIVPPEVAVQNVLSRQPSLLLFEDIREIHLAYLVRPPARIGGNEWVLEPTWVIQVGEKQVYAPALPTSDLIPFQAGLQ